MALLFSTNGPEYVDVGSASSLDDWSEFTYFAWMYVNNTSFTAGRIMSKREKDFYMGGTGNMTLVVGRAGVGGTAYQLGSVPIGEWIFVAATFDDVDGPRLYQGSTTATISEVTYDARTVGTGALDPDADYQFYLGNRPPPSGQNRAFSGRIAIAGAIEKRLTLAELQVFQFHCKDALRYSETKGLWFLHGTGSQPDHSGNGNAGTVTLATAANHVPLTSPFAWNEEPLLLGAPAPPVSLTGFMSANQTVIQGY